MGCEWVQLESQRDTASGLIIHQRCNTPSIPLVKCRNFFLENYTWAELTSMRYKNSSAVNSDESMNMGLACI